MKCWANTEELKALKAGTSEEGAVMIAHQLETTAADRAEFSLLDRIVEESKVAQSAHERARAKDIIGELVSQVLEGEVIVSENLAASIDARVAELDRLISAQLSCVMHAPEFQALESAWTGLHYLCKKTSTGTHLKIKLLNASKRDLVKDFRSAIDFDQSALFKKVYEEEFGTFGGAPFGALVGQFEVTRQPEDMFFIEQMSHIGAAAHAPFITAAAPQLFGLDSYVELGKPRDLAKIFDTVESRKMEVFPKFGRCSLALAWHCRVFWGVSHITRLMGW